MAQTDTRKIDAWAKLRAIANGEVADPREEAIMEARAAGWTYAAIGSALGVSAQSIHEYVQRRKSETKGRAA